MIGPQSNLGELAAFISFGQAFPFGFLALVDTYDTLLSGVPNFLAVALALHQVGFRATGIRLDSGDLAYLSKESRRMFREVGQRFGIDYFENIMIMASSEIDEDVLYSLKEQHHEIDSFGVGTRLVTCYNQPALGGVYKLVEINSRPCMKISQEPSKVTIPGRKEAYRLFDSHDIPVLDLMCQVDAPPPQVGQRILCRHPFDDKKRVFVIPSRVEKLHQCVWDGKLKTKLLSLSELRERTIKQVKNLRDDHRRRLNPTPYKVSLSEEMYSFFHECWMAELPISEIA
eukprot:TRINITY_DN10616_c0_g2_i2.p1 TRINITY_DN10616_c0_g2~~TRINITY_DN10616_c0_g2_i2.p1  ORF type:complete len:286 (-),score=11.97 TRINITY_DN10616_c0_g2_i2:59-916(-)